MKIHEYQGKELLKKFGVAVPRGFFCQSAEGAVRAAESLGGQLWVVKAQIHAGGRGKGGGVKVAKSLDEVQQIMTEQSHRVAAVYDGDRFLGLISIEDIREAFTILSFQQRQQQVRLARNTSQ